VKCSSPGRLSPRQHQHGRLAHARPEHQSERQGSSARLVCLLHEPQNLDRKYWQNAWRGVEKETVQETPYQQSYDIDPFNLLNEKA